MGSLVSLGAGRPDGSERGMAVPGAAFDDGRDPDVRIDECLGYFLSQRRGCFVSVEQQSVSGERSPAPRVVDVAVVAQRDPEARCDGQVPCATAWAGQVEVDQGYGCLVAEYDVGWVQVVVRDELAAPSVGDAALPVQGGAVEGFDAPVIVVKQRDEACQCCVGQSPGWHRIVGGEPGNEAQDFRVRSTFEQSWGSGES